MKNKIYISLVFALLVAIIIVANKPQALANPSILSLAYLNNNTATTSVTYLSNGGATSTLVLSTDRADQVDVNFLGEASSTATAYIFKIEFSNSLGCLDTPNNCNWFRETVNTTSGSVITEAPLPYHTWTPNTNATTTKNVSIALVAAKFTRIGIQAQGAAGSIWAEGVVKSQRP